MGKEVKSGKSVVKEGRWKHNIIMSSFCALHDVTGRSWMLINSATFAGDHLFSVLAAFIRFQSETHLSSSRRLGQRQPLSTVSDLMSSFNSCVCQSPDSGRFQLIFQRSARYKILTTLPRLATPAFLSNFLLSSTHSVVSFGQTLFQTRGHVSVLGAVSK